MHAHVLAHLHIVHTEKGNEQTPVCEVHGDHKIPIFTFQVQTQKQTEQPNQIPQQSPTATGSSPPTPRQG